MPRSFVALVLAALAAFLSFCFPQAVLAYGSTPGTIVAKSCVYYSPDYANLRTSVCITDPQQAGDTNLAAYVVAANGSVCNGYNFTGYSGTFDSASGTYKYTLTKTNCNGSAGGTSTGSWTKLVRTVNVTDCASPNVMGSDGSCYCPSGKQPDASGACVPVVCPAGEIPGTADRVFTIDPPVLPDANAFCVAGCLATASMIVSFTDASGTKHVEAAGPIRSTGAACNPQGQGGSLPSLGAAQPGQAPASAPSVCPVGQCPGTVNGVAVCAACSSVGTGSVTTTPGQSGGTVTSTQCSGGVCTTQTGTIDASGNVTWTSSTTGSGQNATNTPAGGTGATGSGSGNSQSQDQKSFCADNPDSIICKSSSWGGTCGSFTCSGDAVQCQIAKMQADLWCGTSQVPDGIQGKYDALTGEGQAPASFDDKVNLTLPTPEPATCAVQDMNITFIGGAPLVVKLSAMCEYLGYIHTIVVSFGVLMWVFIVFRGK